MDPNAQKLEEILRLTKENNKILHKMRRNAFWGTIFKVLMWAAFIGVPLWLYYTYLLPVMDQVMETYSQVQGVGADASAQIGELQGLLDKLNPSQYLGE